MTETLTLDRKRNLALWLQRRILGFGRHWLAWINGGWGIVFFLPWLAPILIKVGAPGLGRLIYIIYSPLCHQFANRSFFLFGPQAMYSYTELLSYTPAANSPLGLKAFIGTPELGYKVAWSDRMVAMYGGILLGGLIFALVRRHLRAPRWWVPTLMSLPMVLDGITHTISDWAGVGQGFRYHNGWLATLTGNALSPSFYAGTALGSFNSWMRLVTGLLFGLAMAWIVYPILESYFQDTRQVLEARIQPKIVTTQHVRGDWPPLVRPPDRQRHRSGRFVRHPAGQARWRQPGSRLEWLDPDPGIEHHRRPALPRIFLTCGTRRNRLGLLSRASHRGSIRLERWAGHLWRYYRGHDRNPDLCLAPQAKPVAVARLCGTRGGPGPGDRTLGKLYESGAVRTAHQLCLVGSAHRPAAPYRPLRRLGSLPTRNTFPSHLSVRVAVVSSQ